MCRLHLPVNGDDELPLLKDAAKKERMVRKCSQRDLVSGNGSQAFGLLQLALTS